MFKLVAKTNELILVELDLLVHLKELGVLDVLLSHSKFFLLAGKLSLLLLDLLLE